MFLGYLENHERSEKEEEEHPIHTQHMMVADQCQAQPAAGLTVTSEPSTLECLQSGANFSLPATMQTCEPSDGGPESHCFFRAEPTAADCDTSGLSRRAQHGVCFNPCDSHEPRANHSVAASCCRECGAGHLQLFHTRRCSDPQPADMSENFGQSQGLIPVSSQQHQCDVEEMPTFTPHRAHSDDSLDLKDLRESQGEEEVCRNEDRRLDAEVDETPGGSMDVVYFEETEEEEEAELYSEVISSPIIDAKKDHNDFCDNEDSGLSQEYEPSQNSSTSDQCDSESSSEFYAEEDDSSQCSSGDSKPFESSPDGEDPPETISGPSGESEEGSGEWQSFDEEENKEEEETRDDDVNSYLEDQRNCPTIDTIVEDYFVLFDTVDDYENIFPPKRRYISCFDGGDIDDHPFVTDVTALIPEDDDPRLEEETVSEDDTNSKDESCYSEEQSEVYLAEDEDIKPHEDAHGSDDDDDYDDEDLASHEVVFSSSELENMSAPHAEEIHVEVDAHESLMDEDETEVGITEQSEEEEEEEEEEKEEEEAVEEEFDLFDCFSEMEPYWTLLHSSASADFWEEGIEDYYRYQTSVEPSDGEDSSRSESRPDLCLEKDPETLVLFEEPDRMGTAEDEAKTPPVDIIHSVPTQCVRSDGKEPTDEDQACERNTETDEESSDDEQEFCECQYCVPPTEQGPTQPMLPSRDEGKICVVIDLDETLVHSSFQPVSNADYIIPVEIDGTVHQVSVLKRPHVDHFLQRMGEMFECVLFTASLSMYADPVSDVLDKSGAFQTRLFRESCVFHRGNYVKDLSRLGRDLNRVIIIDNSPASYVFHPDNAVPVASWFDDSSDTELLDLLPFFERLSRAENVHDLLQEEKTSS